MANSEQWIPHAGQQTRFLSSSAFEALFGGAAGPGKTDCLLMEAVRQVENPRYNAILFRRVFPSLEAADGLIARSTRWYPSLGGRYNEQKHVWKFPSGARVYFGHMQHESDKLQYQGAQFAYIGFDELTEFLESQYMYMFTRCRAPIDSGIRCYIRNATNPGNIGHEWVKKRFIIRAIVNRLRYFALVNNEDVEVDKSHIDALSRVFFPAKMTDNPSVDPGYRKRIEANPDVVEKARLLAGDWDAQYTGDRVYPDWNFENIGTDTEYDSALDVHWACDDGYVEGAGVGTSSYHPRVILLFQVTPVGGVNVFYEDISTGESSYHTTIDRVLALPYKRPRMAWVDSSAAMFRGALAEKGIFNAGATHEVVEGLKNVRRFIKDENGMRLLKVHPRCTHTIREMPAYKADPKLRGKNGELIPLKIDDHCPDCVRYGLWHLRRT